MREEQTPQLNSTAVSGGQQKESRWQQGLISVIVPVYNIKDYLERCVNSILAQTYRNLEVILVDDGSTDGSGELCDTLVQQDSRIRVIHQANAGSSAARNHGIRESHGEFLGFVDSDDYIAPDMYEKMYEVAYGQAASEPELHRSKTAPVQKSQEPLHQKAADEDEQKLRINDRRPDYYIIQIARDEIAEDGTILPDICIPPEKPVEYTPEDFLREMLLHRGDASMCTKLIHRDLLGDHRFPEGKLNEDFRILVEIFAGTEPPILALPDRGYHVFYKSGSNSRTDKTKFSRVFADCVENADLTESLAAERYPDLIPIARRFALYQRLQYLLHIPVRQMTRENAEYQSVVRYVKDHKQDIQTVPELTKKNRIYLKIFAICNPRTVRYLHAKLKGFDI